MLTYLITLLLTLFIELVVYGVFFRKINILTAISLIIGINLFTHPLATFAVSGLEMSPGIVEVLTIIIEAWLIGYILQQQIWKSLLASSLSNLASFVIGGLILGTAIGFIENTLISGLQLTAISSPLCYCGYTCQVENQKLIK